MKIKSKAYRPQHDQQIIISAPLGDFRHRAHIGRDGIDFGEEYLYSNGIDNVVTKNTYVTQYESPLLKCAIPISQAASIIKTESHDSGNYNNFDQSSTSPMMLNKSRKSSGMTSMHGYKRNGTHSPDSDCHGRCPSSSLENFNLNLDTLKRLENGKFLKVSCDSLSDLDTVGSISLNNRSEKRESLGDECTSLLGDVLAVMDRPQYNIIPGTNSYKRNISRQLSDNTFASTSADDTTRSFTSQSNHTEEMSNLFKPDSRESSINQKPKANNETNVDIISGNSQDFGVGHLCVDPRTQPILAAHAVSESSCDSQMTSGIYQEKSSQRSSKYQKFGSIDNLNSQHKRSLSAMRSITFRNSGSRQGSTNSNYSESNNRKTCTNHQLERNSDPSHYMSLRYSTSTSIKIKNAKYPKNEISDITPISYKRNLIDNVSSKRSDDVEISL